MPYNPQTQSPVLISKKHHALLKKLAKKERRTIQVTLELMIESYRPAQQPQQKT